MASDAELIGRSLAGDDGAFVDMVRRHAAGVSSYLGRRVGAGPAEDLLGEVWVSAFGSRASYDCSYPDAGPWLFGIAHNTLRRYWRNRPNEDSTADMETMPVLSDPWPAVDDHIDGAAVMRRALVNLTPDEREVLLLVTWEQCSVAEAARSLGMPAGTARRCLHQARLCLRSTPGVVALLTEFSSLEEA